MTRDEAIRALADALCPGGEHHNHILVVALRDFADAIAPEKPPMTVADSMRGPITVFGPRPAYP